MRTITRSWIVAAGFALLVLAGSSPLAGARTAAPGASRRPASTATGCVLGSPVVKPGGPAKDTVSSTGQCSKRGKPIATVVTHAYTQLDYTGVACGSVASRPGRSFSPLLSGTYAVKVSFTAVPRAKGTGVHGTTRRTVLTLGHWQRQCSGPSPSAPAATSVCSAPALQFLSHYAPNAFSHALPFYVTLAAPDRCGVLVKGAQGAGLALPQWGGLPLLTGNSVLSPRIVSGAVPCVAKLGSSVNWVDQIEQKAVWLCGSAELDPLFKLYYLPPGGTSVCLPQPAPGPVDYTVGPVDWTGSPAVARVNLPSDWKSWGGQLVIVFEALIVPPNNTQNPYVNHLLGHEYAATTLPLNGAANGCGELTSLRLNHG